MAKAKRLTAKEKRIIRDRTILEWILLVVLLLLAYFFLAQSYKWWPYDTLSDDLGSAFYTTQSALKDVNKSDLSAGNGSSAGSNGTNGTNGSNGGGGTTTPTTGSTTLLRFAAQVNTGMSKEELNAAASGLDQSCTIVANTTTAGKQEVCVYREGGRTATVTLHNDQVVSASLAR